MSREVAQRERDESSELPPGIGRYEVIRPIGEGAMGRVVLAHDPVLGRDVAIKLLRADLQIPRDVKEGLVARMRHEARAAARVPHPNIVTLHDMGEDADLGLYLVFEYVEGPTLKHRLLDGALTPKQTGRLARELGAALTVAHSAGIVHRDVKPENVILSMTGGKIADFGIARIPDSTLTHAGGLMGTPAYSAPETFKKGQFSAESDQFSLAATLYEALSGERAFPGDDAAIVAARIQTDTAAPIAGKLSLPATIDEVLARALARDPAARFPSCEAFGVALADAIAARGTQPSLPGSPAPPPAADETQPLPGGPPPYAAVPRERKLGQVVLGGAVVVVTAVLLVRAALKSEANADPPLVPTTAAPAAASPSAPHVRPPPSPAPIRPHRPTALPDAGPGDSPPASSASAAPSGQPTVEPAHSAAPPATSVPAAP